MFKYLSIITVIALNVHATGFTHPLQVVDRSVEYGGTKTAIAAYSDGIGVHVYDEVLPVNNSAMNTLVFKYGESAATNSVPLPDFVLTNSTSISDKKLATDLKNTAISSSSTNSQSNGTICDDGNPQTINDIYTNGVCAGTNVEGQSCNDANSQTINDAYHNGVCIGVNVEGQSCNDNNAQTTNDIYHNGICAGTIQASAIDTIDIQLNGYQPGAGGATITEIELYDANNNLLHYGITAAPDSNNITYLNAVTGWGAINLNDGDITYTSNSDGLDSSMFFDKPGTLRLTADTSKIKKVIIYLGSPEGRIPTTIDIKNAATGAILNTITADPSWLTVRPITISF